MSTVTITVVDDLTCPTCGCGETHPHDAHIEKSYERRLTIRAFKVETDGHWWSQCLVCSGYYDKDLNETPDNWDRNKGWF